MIDYDSFLRCHLTDIFFAFHAGAKELKQLAASVFLAHDINAVRANRITQSPLQFSCYTSKVQLLQYVTFWLT